MPILHGVNGSPFVRKVQVACAEKGIAYEQNPVIPLGVSDEYRVKSPLGKIPCWEDGDFVLPDSSCIIAYLERTHPQPALYPGDPKEFGRALWYEEYGDSKVAETFGPIFFERYIKPNLMQQETDEERVRTILAENVPPVLDYLEGEIGDREVMVGSHFSIADIAVTSIMVNVTRFPIEPVDLGPWPRWKAYVERTHAHPSFKSVIEAELAG